MKTTFLGDMDMLSLGKNESIILSLMRREQEATPLRLAKLCHIPRPTIYITLAKLENRGLVRVRKVNKKKVWQIVDRALIKDKIEDLKNTLTSDKDTYDRIKITDDTDITIHRGSDAIVNLFNGFAENHNGKRLMGMSGSLSAQAWKDVVDLESINTINSTIKDKGLLTEMIANESWFRQQVDMFGESWIEHFTGRATQIHFIESKYLDYESQIFIFGNELYLVSMREKLFIEVKNRQIARLIISLLNFVEDNSRVVDINQILKNMAHKKGPRV